MGPHAVGRTVVVDARCLQDLNYLRRGIGRHALALLRGVPRAAGLKLVGLIDPLFPPLIEEVRGAFDAVRVNAYAARSGAAPKEQPAAYVSLSPMTHDPLFSARLLADSSLLRMAVVYDFIPHRHPERYLPSEAHRLDYAVQLRWLAAYDLFAPISKNAADDLVTLLGVARRQIAVTGAPLDPTFEAVPAQDVPVHQRHVLVVGGADPRKNPETVIRAHARSAALQAKGIPLVVGGHYELDHAHAFRQIAEAAGGRPDLVEVPGHMAQEALVNLYRDARVVVCASYDEGFSLPVIEGMATGAVVLASNIPAHAELLPDAQHRFLASDDGALASLLERAWSDMAWRTRALAGQGRVWPCFREAEVSKRFWAPLVAGLEHPLSSPALLHGRRPRVAMLSPLPPDRSGVADYTAATCLDFGKLVELHVFTDTVGFLPLLGSASVRPLDALPCLLPSFDRVVGVLGNSHFHLRIFELLQAYGGAAIAHDARMLGFYHALLGEQRAIAQARRELGHAVTIAELQNLKALFLGEVALAAAPMIVHSPVTVEIIEQRYNIKAAYLPFSIYRPWLPEELNTRSRAAARRRLKLREKELIIATFGYVHSSKAPEECIWAIEILRRWKIPARLHFVGGVENLTDQGTSLLDLAKRIGVHEHVEIISNYVSEQTYRDYLAGSDFAIQLRTHGFGSVSGALLDCSAAGLPTVANVGLIEAIDAPQGYIHGIPDSLSPLLLAEALAELVASGMAETRPEAERRAFSEERSFKNYSRSLCDVLHLEATA